MNKFNIVWIFGLIVLISLSSVHAFVWIGGNITLSYANSTINLANPGSVTLTNNGATINLTNGYVGLGYGFTSATQYLSNNATGDYGNFRKTNGVTIATWINLKGNNSAYKRAIKLSNSISNKEGYGLQVRNDASIGACSALTAWLNTPTGDCFAANCTAIADSSAFQGKWIAVIAVYNSSGVYLYVNSSNSMIQVAYNTYNYAGAACSDNTPVPINYISLGEDSGEQFIGSLDEVVISNTTWTQAEMNTWLNATQSSITYPYGLPSTYNYNGIVVFPTNNSVENLSNYGEQVNITVNLTNNNVSMSSNVNFSNLELISGSTIYHLSISNIFYNSGLWYINATAPNAISGLYDLNITALDLLNNNYQINMTSKQSVKYGSLSFSSPTPANNAIQYYLNNSLILNTTLLVSSNTFLTVYYFNGTLFSSYNATGMNVNYTFTNMPVGQYYFNASTNVSGAMQYTDTRLFTIYDIIPGTITNPANDENQSSEFLNISWSNSSTSFNATNINNFIVSLHDTYGAFIANLVTTNNLSYNWDVYNQNLSTGNYNVLVTANDSLGNMDNYSFGNFNLLTNSVLNITAFNISLSAPINSFNISSVDLNNSMMGFFNTSSGTAFINMVKGHTYNITLASVGFSSFVVYTASSANLQFLQLISGPINSLTINVFNESSGAFINQSTSLILTNIVNNQQYPFNTVSGSILTSALPVGNYSLIVSSPSPIYYFPRYYSVLVNNNYQMVNVYIAATNLTVVFNTKTSAGTPLANVLVTQLVNVNGSVVVVQSSLSDVSGKAQFSYIPFTYYSFSANISGYAPTSFSLNPVLYPSYDIVMNTLSSGLAVPTAYVTSSPLSFYNGQNGVFNFAITSTYNGLSSYSYTLTGPGVNVSNGGFNPNGGAFNSNFSLTNVSSGQFMNFTYNYVLSNGVNYSLSTLYPINVPLYNETLYSLGQGSLFGFDIGDRVLIVTLINIICFGVGFAVIGPVGGLALALFNTSIFATTGFVPWYVFYVMFVIAIFYMLGRGFD